MIGVTAAASAGVYLLRGDINPRIAAPVALGVLIGATIGTKIMQNLKSKTIRIGVVLSAIIVFVGLSMFLISGNSGYAGSYFPTSLVFIILIISFVLGKVE